MEHVSPHFRQSAPTSKSMRVADCNPGTGYSRYETRRCSQLNRFVLYNRCQDDRLFSQWTLRTRRNKLRSAIIAGIEEHSRKWKAIVARSAGTTTITLSRLYTSRSRELISRDRSAVRQKIAGWYGKSMTRPGEIFIAPKLADAEKFSPSGTLRGDYKYVRPRLNPIFLQ